MARATVRSVTVVKPPPEEVVLTMSWDEFLVLYALVAKSSPDDVRQKHNNFPTLKGFPVDGLRIHELYSALDRAFKDWR